MPFLDDIVLNANQGKKITLNTSFGEKHYGQRFLLRQEKNDLDVKIEVIVP